MNKQQLFTYLTVLSIILSCICCSNRQSSSNDEANDGIETPFKTGDRHQILSQLKRCADLATTEVTIRKIAIYDTSKSEHFTWTDPSTWKYGDQKCIIPIEVKIKYGYDLRNLSIDKIKILDDSTAIAIFLPKPKIIDAGYNAKIEEGSVTSMSTGLRQKVGHELQEEIRRKGYESVLKEDLSLLIDSDIENNAKTLIEGIVKNLGWKNVQIETYNK